jgi:MFS family permease
VAAERPLSAVIVTTPLTEPRSHCFRSAGLGAVAWVAALVLWPRWEVALLLLAPLVVVPLGLALAASPDRQPWPWRAAVWLQLPAALALLGAFALNTGPWAALLAVPWLAVTVLAALHGLVRLRSRGPGPVEELCIDAGLVYLAVGGGWLVLSRWGARPVGFDDLIVLLTAVHFHYAGFVLPLLTGLAGRALRSWEARVAAVGVIAGVPLVAVGINLAQLHYRGLEPWAASLLAAAATLTAVLHMWLAGRSAAVLQRWLFTVAGVSLLTGMLLAAVYAWGRYSGIARVEIPEMLPSHGAINAVGFALAGVLGWVVGPRPDGDAKPQAAP